MATSKSPIKIPASQIVGALALVLGRAELHLAGGIDQNAAIDQALRDCPVSHAVAVVCRFAWRIMLRADQGGDDNPDPGTDDSDPSGDARPTALRPLSELVKSRSKRPKHDGPFEPSTGEN